MKEQPIDIANEEAAADFMHEALNDAVKFIYHLGTDKAYLEIDGVMKEVACFDVKWQTPSMDGTSRTWYWPKRLAQRRKAQKVLNETGIKPHLETL